MGWSLSIGRLFGIPVKIHITLVVMIGILALLATTNGAMRGLFLILLLFSSVLAHELGHALVARRYGVNTREIVLLPIGGAALLSDAPDRPGQMFWIALAGPLVSLVLAGIAWLGYQVMPLYALGDLFVINLLLGLFNLIPAFPLDGGRMLRAGLTRWMGRLRATRVAAKLGRLLAVGFVMVGSVYGEFVLALVGIFVFFAATAEERAVIIQTVIGTRSVGDLMQKVPFVLGASLSAADAAARFREYASVKAAPVLFGSKILGVVHRDKVLALDAAGRANLQDALDRNIVVDGDEDLPLTELLTRMGQAKSRVAVIGDGADIRGVLTVDHVLDEIRAAKPAEL